MSISKLLKITLSALLLAQTVWAQTVVNIPRGNSFTALLVFNSSYNPSRIDDISVWVGSKSWGTLGEGKVKTTANARQFRVEITSDETRNYTGRNEFIVSVKDSVLGVRKVIAGVLNFTEAGRYSNAIINSGVDWTVNINVSEAGITSNATLATIFKGDTGDTGATGAAGANAQNPNFSVSTGAAGSNVSVSGSYPNLTLTIPRGDTGATGAAGSDANVTSGNIASALGYTPVSPTQLGAKQDTSASITTAKISDWTAAWAARFAAQSTSNLVEGTNLYHTTARVQAVGDARYLPLTGGVLTNASTYQLRLAYDASNYLSATVSSTGSTTFQPTGTNAGININTTGTGVITTGATILPSLVSVHDLGSIDRQFSIVWASIARITNYRPHGNGSHLSFQNSSGTQSARMFHSGNWIFGTGTTDNSSKVNIQGKATVSDDVEITDKTKGIILSSPNNTRYRITVANGGTLTLTAL